MNKTEIGLHPDLVISMEAAIDRMSVVASAAADKKKHNFGQQIRILRNYAKQLCEDYHNCRSEDWCFLCASGSNGKLFRGDVCLECKLLPADVYQVHKSTLLQISGITTPTDLNNPSLNSVDTD
jgi:hypothetical protein